MTETLEVQLRKAAETVEVSPVIPGGVARGIRVRQAGWVAGAALSLVALLSVGLIVLSPDPQRVPEDIPPAGGGDAFQMARGTYRGIEWRMVVHPAESAPGDGEGVCVEVGAQGTCLQIADHGGTKSWVGLRYIDPLDAVVIVQRTPPGMDGFSVRELNGTNWASLIADVGGGDEGPTYWYRFLAGHEVAGVIDTGDSRLSFEVSKSGDTVHEGLSAGGEEFPELEGLPGVKELIASGPEGGGYSLIMRTTDSEVCFHLNGATACRAGDVAPEPFGLTISKVLPCRSERNCGTDNDHVVIAGEVTPEVYRVGITDDIGTSWVYIDPTMGGCCFVTNLYGQVGEQVELIAQDEDENLLGSTTITYE